MSKLAKAAATVLLGMAVSFPTALAGPDDRTPDKARIQAIQRESERRAAIEDKERLAMRRYLGRDQERLIRSYYGDVADASGRRKESYGVGSILPREAELKPLPRELLDRLPTPPDGYSYGRHGGKVYLIETAKRRIVDAVALGQPR